MSEPKSQTKPKRGEFERYSKEACARFLEELFGSPFFIRYTLKEAHRQLEWLTLDGYSDATHRRLDAIQAELRALSEQKEKMRLGSKARSRLSLRFNVLHFEQDQIFRRLDSLHNKKMKHLNSTAGAGGQTSGDGLGGS